MTIKFSKKKIVELFTDEPNWDLYFQGFDMFQRYFIGIPYIVYTFKPKKDDSEITYID